MRKIDKGEATKILVNELHMLPFESGDGMSPAAKVILQAELARIGFRIKNPEVLESLSDFSNSHFRKLISHLLKMKGGDVKHVPLFKKFPDDVPEDSEMLFKRTFAYLLNVMSSFSSEEDYRLDNGMRVPKFLFDMNDFNGDPILGRQDTTKYPQGIADQAKRTGDTHVNWVDLKLMPSNKVQGVLKAFLHRNLYSKSSIKESLQPTIVSLLSHFGAKDIDPSKIVHKEIRSFLMKFFWDEKEYELAAGLASQPVDLLRMFAAVTDSDVSLSEKIKFPKMNRKARKAILASLESMYKPEESMKKYSGLWLQLGRYIHPGEHKAKFPKAFVAFDNIRSGKAKTFESKIESMISSKDKINLIRTLKSRPGTFARNLHHVLRAFPDDQKDFLNAFDSVADKVGAKNLLSMYTYFKTINESTYRTVINKKSNIKVLNNNSFASLGDSEVSDLSKMLTDAVIQNLPENEELKDKIVYIDPDLEKMIVPLHQRKMSDGMLNFARGTRVKLDGHTVRAFVYWKENGIRTDYDLSAIMFDEFFNKVGHVSYTRLADLGVSHSGDFTSAPQGASEFIDVPLDNNSLAKKCRYIGVQVYVYTGSKFPDIEAFGGWMTRDKTDKSTKTFDAKTVQNKLDLNGPGAYSMPMLIDLHTKEMVIVDLYINGIDSYNRVEGTTETVAIVLSEVNRFGETKPNLMQLAEMNVVANSGFVTDLIEEAELTIGTAEADIDFTNVSNVLSKYI